MNSYKRIFIISILLTISIGTAFYYYERKHRQVPFKQRKHRQIPFISSSDNLDETTRSVLSYICQPKYRNIDFLKQITVSDAKLEFWDLKEKYIYFSIPNDINYKKQLSNFSKNYEKIEFAIIKNNLQELGKYRYRRNDRQFFRMPDDNFKLDNSKTIEVNFTKLKYIISINELSNYIQNKCIFGGVIIISNGVKNISNHGAFVAKQEPSLERLADKIISKSSSKEEMIQRLTTFVTNEIEYNYKEAYATYETLKRPNEVLMTKTSDCSGKGILLSSLFEQKNIDYLLLYFDKHIAVAVSGNFPNKNKLKFKFRDDYYHLVEPTCQDFKIGITKLDKQVSFSKILYLQKPGEGIFDKKSNKLIYHYR